MVEAWSLVLGLWLLFSKAKDQRPKIKNDVHEPRIDVQIYLASPFATAHWCRHQRHFWPVVSLSGKADRRNRSWVGCALVSNQYSCNLFLRFQRQPALAKSLREHPGNFHLDSGGCGKP